MTEAASKLAVNRLPAIRQRIMTVPGMLAGTAGLVTAAGSGIGRASALAMAEAGGAVVVSDVNDKAGEETVKLIVAAGGVASFVHADVSVEDDVAALVSSVVERYGRLDWAHNNAALGTAPGTLTEIPQSQWDRCLAVTTTGTMYCLKHEILQMQDGGQGGSIVNTSSTAGLVGMVNQSAYAAAKWGVVGLTKTTALEYASDGIRVNAICPGLTTTAAVKYWAGADPEGFEEVRSAIPMGALSEPEQQAQAAVWLCSDLSSYVTGVALPVDGGVMAGA